MSDKTTALAKHVVGFLTPSSMSEAVEAAKIIAASDFVPKQYMGKPGNVLVAMQMGSELGLSPMASLQNVAVINGRPCLWGDAVLAIVTAHPDFEDIIESVDGDTATCVVKRRGREPVARTFSVDDAKAASLWGKQGPWSQYPKRMLQMRARAFAVRDVFPDALRGLQVAEEMRDCNDVRKDPSEGKHTFKVVDAKQIEAPKDESEHVESLLPRVLTWIENARTLDQLSEVAIAIKDCDLSDDDLSAARKSWKKRESKLNATESVDMETGEVEQNSFGFAG